MISYVPITTLQLGDSSLIKILSEEEDYCSMDLSSQEHEDKIDNPVASPNDGFYGGQPPVMQNDTWIKRISSFTNDSSSEKTLRSTMKTIKLKKTNHPIEK